MNWLTNFVKPKLLAIKSKFGKKENLWTKCNSCQQMIFTKELKEKRRKEKALKSLMEEEEQKKKLEYIKIKEWEEKFDREQKLREQEEIRREQKLKEKELQRLRLEEKENLKPTVSTGLEKFDVDKTSEN